MEHSFYLLVHGKGLDTMFVVPERMTIVFNVKHGCMSTFYLERTRRLMTATQREANNMMGQVAVKDDIIHDVKLRMDGPMSVGKLGVKSSVLRTTKMQTTADALLPVLIRTHQRNAAPLGFECALPRVCWPASPVNLTSDVENLSDVVERLLRTYPGDIKLFIGSCRSFQSEQSNSDKKTAQKTNYNQLNPQMIVTYDNGRGYIRGQPINVTPNNVSLRKAQLSRGYPAMSLADRLYLESMSA